MKKAIVLLCIVAVALLASRLKAAQEQWLDYKVLGDLPQAGDERSVRPLNLTRTPPSGVALPHFAGDEQFFARWETPLVKAGFLWIALDCSGDKGSAYIDTNCNGSLADESPVPISQESCGCIGPVKIVFAASNGAITYHLLLMHQSAPLPSQDASKRATHFLLAVSGCCYEGEVTIGGARCRCTLYDYNANGTFDDVSKDPAQADRIKLTTDAAERFYMPGKYLVFGGSYFHPAPAADGASISFETIPPKTIPMGTVHVPSSVKEVGIAGEMGLIYLDTSKGEAQAPAGDYVIHHWLSDRADKSGVGWKITGTDFPRPSTFRVVPGKEADLDVGEPVTALVDSNKTGDLWALNAMLVGRSGESIKMALTDGGVVPTPTLTIENKAETFTRDFQLEYG